MLRITQQDSSHAAKKYYSQADYYSEGQELVGSWGGKGAERLGLEGVVDKESFERLCDNRHPMSGEQLTVRTRSDRTVGYDFTFSVPKSVSLLYALSGDQQILDAFRSAVDETMRDMEAEMKTRVRRGGKDAERVTGNMVWAEFIHTTSRPVDGVPDPQLHAHVFAFNSTWDGQEGRWKAGQFRDLKRDAPYYQAGFRVRLANKLQELGFGIERKRDDFELAGVPASAIKRFSRRTEKIEKVAAELGITDPNRKAELGEKTREKKSHELSWNQLRREWVGRLTEQEQKALAETHRRETPCRRVEQGEGMAVDYALAHSFAREAVVPERKLLTEAMKRGLGEVTVEGVERELAGRPLVRGKKEGRAFATTETVLAEEERVVAFAREGRGKFRPLGDEERPFARAWLNEGQRNAVRHVLASRDRVSIIRGVAGTGKTTLEQELGEALAERGLPVAAMAQSVRAVQVLKEKAGFGDACTVAGFLMDKRKQSAARGGVLLVDEASQLGSEEMLKLFAVAGEIGARVVLVGDRRQHRAVARGEPLKLLEEKAGLPVAEVTQILRQEHREYRQAVKHLSEGEVAQGFGELDRLGWIKEVADGQRYKQLAGAYLAAVGEKAKGKPATALVVTPTHAEAARITGAIRGALKAEGKLKDERLVAAWMPANLTAAEKSDATSYEPGDLLQFHQNAPGHKKGSRLTVAEGDRLPLQYAERFELYRPAELALAVGDRVRVTAGGKSKDGKHKLANGALFTVHGFTRQGEPIVDHGWVIPAKDGAHLAMGYAVTSHASQGSTVGKVFIGQSSQSLGATNRRQAYVSISRGKKQAVVFTDDKQALIKAAQRADEPMSAMELAGSRQRKPSFRQRLKRHVGYLRRWASFAQRQDAGMGYREPARELQREVSHGR